MYLRNIILFITLYYNLNARPFVVIDIISDVSLKYNLLILLPVGKLNDTKTAFYFIVIPKIDELDCCLQNNDIINITIKDLDVYKDVNFLEGVRGNKYYAYNHFAIIRMGLPAVDLWESPELNGECSAIRKVKLKSNKFDEIE